jgi:CHAD domain-containing protein
MGKTRRTILQKRIQHQHQLLFRLVRKVKKQGDKKSIHQLRVCLKSWQAFYDFCSYAHPTSKNSIQFPKNWKKLFRQLGKLREIQVTVDSIRELKLRKDLRKEIEIFFNATKKKRRKKIFFLAKRMQTKSEKQLLTPFRFLRKRCSKKLFLHTKKIFFDKHLVHAFEERKQQKKYFDLHGQRTHLRKIIQLIYFFGLTEKVHKQIPLYKTILLSANQLGKWHDAWVMKKLSLKFLKRFPLNLTSREKASLVDKITKIESSYYQQSQQILRDFYKADLKSTAKTFQECIRID